MVERTVTISVLMLHLIVLAIGAYLATTGQISVGTFVTFESAFWEISYNIAHLMHFIPGGDPVGGGRAAHAGTARRAGARDGPSGRARYAAHHQQHHLRPRQLCLRRPEKPVIDNLTLQLASAQRIAVVGPSGSGKSTLLNLILRVYTPTEARSDRRRRHSPRHAQLAPRQHGGRVPGKHAVQHVAAREHPLGKEAPPTRRWRRRRARPRSTSYIMSLPEDYDTPVGERGDTLSGGQRQRIAIARAIVRNPSLLLLDEATSALDQTTEAAINRTLLNLAKGRTMILSTHRLTSVVEMDEIIVISGGRVIERGSHASRSRSTASIASSATTRAIGTHDAAASG